MLFGSVKTNQSKAGVMKVFTAAVWRDHSVKWTSNTKYNVTLGA